MNSRGKVRYVIEDSQVNHLSELSSETQENLISHLKQWKQRVAYAAIEHHLSSKYPNENLTLKWSNDEVKI